MAVLDREPEPDLDAWEAIEQAVIEPPGKMRITDEDERAHPHYPDLTGGHDLRFLAVRVNVRGRDRPTPNGAIHPGADPPRSTSSRPGRHPVRHRDGCSSATP